MNLIFNEIIKHNRIVFSPGLVYQIDDPVAAAYFIATGWGTETADPANVIIPDSEASVDPDTVFGAGPNKGRKVLGS